MKRIFVLSKQSKITELWMTQSYHSNYNSAQKAFIHKEGLFKIVEHEVRD